MTNKQIIKKLNALPEKILERYEERWEVCKYLYLFDYYPFTVGDELEVVAPRDKEGWIYTGNVYKELPSNLIKESLRYVTTN